MAEREYQRNEGGQFGSNPFTRKAKEGGGGAAEGKGGYARMKAARAAGTWGKGEGATSGDKLAKWAGQPDEPKGAPEGEQGGKEQAPHPEAAKHAETVKKAGGLDPTPARVWHDEKPSPDLPDETWQPHFDGHPDQGGKPSAERVAAVHAPIMEKALNVPPVAPGVQKIAVVTMGGPASGKSSGLGALANDPNFVKVDPDGIKEQLPEYQKAIDPAATWTKAAAMAHEESSYIAKQIKAKAIEQGNHLIVDGTGANAEKFMQGIEDLKAKGYQVHLVMPHVEVEEALPRAMARGQKIGRIVPEPFIREAYSKIPNNFERIAAKVDSFKMVDTSSNGFGKVVWEKPVGKAPVVHDPAFVSNFQSKYGSSKAPGSRGNL